MVDVAPFLVPVIGAVITFILGRGSALRRARTTALEDLQVHEKTVSMLGDRDPLVDQINAHARASVRKYNALRAAADQRRTRILVRSVVSGIVIAAGVVAVVADVDDTWGPVLIGAAAGLVALGVEPVVQRLQVRQALRAVGTDRHR